MNPKTFTTWTHKGVRFLAVDNGAAFHITDENGGNCGSWLSKKEFRKRQSGGEIFDSFGHATVRIVPSR